MIGCPACADEAFVARKFSKLDLTGCRSVKVRTAPVDQLCAAHREERERIDASMKDKAQRDADDWRESVRALCVRLCGEEIASRGRWIADIEAMVTGKESRSDLRRPWINNNKTVPELHLGAWEYDVRVCIGTTNVVEIYKFYGPLVAQPVRVSIENGMWVIERKVEEEDPEPGMSSWVQVAHFPIDGDV